MIKIKGKTIWGKTILSLMFMNNCNAKALKAKSQND
jgi:hypothetical protein